MNTLTEIQDLTFNILDHPQEYSPPVLAKAYMDLQRMKIMIRNAENVLKRELQLKMEKENATKIVFIDEGGDEHICSIKPGSKQATPDIEQRYREAGYDPLELGKYEYKANWSNAKKLIAFGGDKATLLKELFIEGPNKIEIE